MYVLIFTLLSYIFNKGNAPVTAFVPFFSETLNAIGVGIIDGTEKTFEFELFNAL